MPLLGSRRLVGWARLALAGADRTGSHSRVGLGGHHDGDVVVRDNLSAHEVSGVRDRIEAADAELLYLPPYSPDFHPIEQCWAQLQQYLRAAKARTLFSLEQKLDDALRQVTPIKLQA